MNIAIVILAAGESQRLGRPKQRLPYGGSTLLGHAIETALASLCRPVIVVLGAYADQIRSEIDASEVLVVVNEDWKEGMSTSIRAGLAAVEALPQEVDGALFMLCDQPLVNGSLLDRLATAFYESKLPIAACDYDGDLGVPALFARRLFPELLTLQGAAGAKPLLRKHGSEAVCLPFPEGSLDIDTPEDYPPLKS